MPKKIEKEVDPKSVYARFEPAIEAYRQAIATTKDNLAGADSMLGVKKRKTINEPTAPVFPENKAPEEL